MKRLFARMEHPNNGYESDKKDAALLDPKKLYEVKEVHMGQSNTCVELDTGFKRTLFNSVNLEFYLEGSETPHDIYSDPDYNPYIQQIR